MQESSSVVESIEIDNRDVLRVILQFLKESNLMQSFQMLQEEADVPYRGVDNLDTFINDIYHGQWENVIVQLSTLGLSKEKECDVYEQVILELLELRETHTVRAMLRDVRALLWLREHHLQRFLELESLLNKIDSLSEHAMIDASMYARSFLALPSFRQSVNTLLLMRDARRRALATLIGNDISVLPPSRLKLLLGQALAYQQQNNEDISSSTGHLSYDLFYGTSSAVDTSGAIQHFDKTLSSSFNVECARFSLPMGDALFIGTREGYFFVLNPISGQLRLHDLSYQAKKEYIQGFKNSAVLSIASRDQLVALGCQHGDFLVLNYLTGERLVSLPSLHAKGITSLQFIRSTSDSATRDSVLSTSFDGTIKLIGLKSCKVLKEFRLDRQVIHTAVVKDPLLIAGGNDGQLKLFDWRTLQFLQSVQLYEDDDKKKLSHASIHTILSINIDGKEYLFVGNESTVAYLLSKEDGAGYTVHQRFKSNKSIFLHATYLNDVMYCVTEDSTLFGFNCRTGEILSTLSHIHDGEVIGMHVHPKRNMLITYNDVGHIKSWRA